MHVYSWVLLFISVNSRRSFQCHTIGQCYRLYTLIDCLQFRTVRWAESKHLTLHIVRNVWHNHCISSLRSQKKNIKRRVRKLMCCHGNLISAAAWRKILKVFHHSRVSDVYILKQRNESTSICVWGQSQRLASQWCRIDWTNWGFLTLVFSHWSSRSSWKRFLFVMHFGSELEASPYVRWELALPP